MISNDIQELLKNITKSLIKIETKELDVLISRQLTHIDNIDFHRYEISHREIGSLKFSFCSFRGAFISYSSFTNCNFINCSFITAMVCNTKFTNCTFINCVFRSMHIQDNLISNCSFQNCYIEDNIFSTNEI
ncbi:pentapeptide repeat-containing protein [Neisseria lactamica]|uniref:pentapeptide repeat-containing protein n=1 Tax=Neisseria lactamica TaxID=486 RepID=UPI00114560C1